MTTEQTAHCGNCGSTAGKLSGHVYFHCGMCFHVTDPLAEDRGTIAKDLRALIARLVVVEAVPCGKHREHELEGGIVYYCPWCEGDQLVDEDHPYRSDRMKHEVDCPAQQARELAALLRSEPAAP